MCTITELVINKNNQINNNQFALPEQCNCLTIYLLSHYTKLHY